MFAKVRRISRSVYHRFRLRGSRFDAPIVVYQMGKVGSLTIARSLRMLDLRVPVYHAHALNHLDEIERAALRRVPPTGQADWDHLKACVEVRRQMDAERSRRWDFITMVREPVGRNLSAFFQRVADLVPGFREKLAGGELTNEQMTEAFLKDEATHAAPETWFDAQLRDLVGIDVFVRPYPHAAGHDIFENDRARVLVMRLEDFPRCVPPAMRRFFGIRHFRLRSANLSDDKEYASIYRRLRKEIVLPEAYLDRMYGLKMTRHFYTPEEIAAFRKSWTRAAQAAG